MKIKLICQYCKNDFYRNPSKSWSSKKGAYGKIHKKFCSPECAHNSLIAFWNSPAERKARSIRAMGDKNGRWMNGISKYIAKCVDCGQPVSARQGVARCSKCYGRIISQTRIGENHWNWQGGKTQLKDGIRNLDKSKCWRIAVFKRDDYTCQECGKTKTYLEAHHIKEFCYLVSNFLNKYKKLSPIKDVGILLKLALKYKPFWDINNGTTLCIKCHNKTKKSYNFKRKIDLGKKDIVL
jgi:hypothetical protein